MLKHPMSELNFAKSVGFGATILAVVPIIIGVINVPAFCVQSDERFEVASVRRVEIPATERGVQVFPTIGGIGTSDPSRITYRATWLPSLLADAFNVRSDQITGPSWLSTERYDIVAIIPMGTTKDQFKVMLRNLLIDRFGLRFHMDSKIRSVYALRLRKNAPKVKQTERRSDDTTISDGVGIVGAPDAQGCPILPPNYRGIVGRPNDGVVCWAAQDVPLADLTRLIEPLAARPVIDETGLAGHYDFKIRFQSFRRLDGGVASDPIPTVFSAVEEQLGLTLESATSTFPELIIESIERAPSEN